MLSFNTTLHRFFLRLLVLFALGSLLGGCGTERDLVRYSFEFDLRYDNQHAEILDYWYGKSKNEWRLRADEDLVKSGRPIFFESVTGQMLSDNLLYVKWRDTDIGKVYEDTVDLRNRMPRNIEDHTIYLMIKGPQLYVYLVSPERRPSNVPSNGPSMYGYRKVTTLYPDQPKQ